MGKGLLVVLLSAMGLLAHSQSYYRPADSLLREELRSTYGQYKEIPPQLELQALRALSHYPELRDTHIAFRFVHQKTAHSAQPILFDVPRRYGRRRYVIRISTRVPAGFENGLQENLPYPAQIGVLAHELAHIVQYEELHRARLLATGLRYATSKNFVQRMEHAADSIVIAHRLGPQLLAWATIAQPLLKNAGRAQNYLTPDEIRSAIK